MGGWPGEVEEEGRAVEGKQGMEEVTWTDLSSKCFVVTIIVSIRMTTTCSMEAGKPGRPIEEETFGAVK